MNKIMTVSRDRKSRKVMLPVSLLKELEWYDEKELNIAIVDGKLVITKIEEPILFVK